jgi:hypothetical protein
MSRFNRPEPFGKAGLTVAICALVLALVGGAYAAGGLTKSQEKQVTKIAKKYAGKPGATGPAGPAGTPGTNGTNGAAGKNGTSVTSEAASAGECPEGGTKFTAGASTSKVCNGSPWTAGGTLPKGSTEKGSWSVTPIEAAYPPATFGRGAISFGIPLQSAPTVQYVKEGETGVEHCPGTVANPKADEGFLCLYAAAGEHLGTISNTFEEAETWAVGANLLFVNVCPGCPTGHDPGFVVYGTWAVTAP